MVDVFIARFHPGTKVNPYYMGFFGPGQGFGF